MKYIPVTWLPYSVAAAVVMNEDGSYTILTNAKMSVERQYEAALHEVDHIEHDDFHSDDDVNAIEYERHKYQKPLKRSG